MNNRYKEVLLTYLRLPFRRVALCVCIGVEDMFLTCSWGLLFGVTCVTR